ncbi:AsmA family protein [Vibrio fortis]
MEGALGMKKVIMVVGIVLSVLVAAVATLLLGLQTQYRTDIANFLLKHSISHPITVEDVDYQAPYELTLQGITSGSIDDESEPLYIDKLQLWLNPNSFFTAQLELDSLLISGVQWQSEELDLLKTQLTQPKIKLHQLAINNLDFSTPEFSARDLDIQIANPDWANSQQLLPNGKIQLKAGQIFWQNEALDNFLIDLDLKTHDSTLYGVSFDWRGAKISGQAEQYPNGWSLINVTIDGLHLSQKQTQQLLKSEWQIPNFNISHINSLDILKSDIAWQDGHLAAFSASFENIQLPFRVWQQQQGYFSLQAESLSLQDEQWIEPNLKLTLQDDQIEINDFYSQWQQGSVQLNGQIGPRSIKLQELDVRGVKWVTESAEEQEPLRILQPWLQGIEFLSISRLNVERSQRIQLANQPYWQVSGLHIEGQGLTLIEQGKWGLWEGELSASANDASYQSILSAQPVVEMSSHQGQWQLKRLFAPLKQGYIEAQAIVDFNQVSQPWQATISADGVPLSPFIPYLALPFDASGIGEFELQASGLAGDDLMLRHSATASLEGSIRNGVINFASNDAKANEPLENEAMQSKIVNFEIADIKADLNRGYLSLPPLHIIGATRQDDQPQPVTLTGEVAGELDLVTPQAHSLTLTLSSECYEVSGLVTQAQLVHKESCQ